MGFVLGEVLYLLGMVAWIGILAAGPAVFFGMYLLTRKGRDARVRLLPFLACWCFVLAGGARLRAAENAAERALGLELDGEFMRLEGTVHEVKEDGERVVLVLTGCQEVGRVQVYLDAEDGLSSPICIGNRIRVAGEMSAFSAARNPGEFDYRLYYRSLKLNYRMWADSWTVTGDRCDHYREALRRLAGRVKGILGQITGGEDTGIYEAVLLGDKAELDGEVRELYQRNGIAHLLAISGLHLSLIGLAAYTLFRRLGAGFGRAGILGAAVIVSYAVLTGASASVVRASLMLLCGFLAAYLGRTYDLLSALGLSAVLLLWDSPYLITQAGFQLSFGAVGAIGWMAPRMEHFLEPEQTGRLPRGLLAGICVQLATGPVVLYHYFQIPVYGIVLNLVVIPLMAYVVASGLAGIFLGVWSIAAGRLAVGAGHGILTFYRMLCQWCEALPGSNFVAGRPQVWRLLWYALMVFVIFIGMEKTWFRRKRTALTALLAATVVLLVPLPVRGLTVTFLDVGQGDGICLRTRDAVVLMDGGSTDEKLLGKYRLEPFLKSGAVTTVDYAFVSHGDEDHVSGLTWLLKEGKDIRIRHLMLPALGREDPVYAPLAALVEAQGGTIHWIRQGDRLELGKLTLTCIYPGGGDVAEDRNEQSLVIKADYGQFHLLLTGDMSGRGEQAILEDVRMRGFLSDVQVLKLAHHGSRFSNTADWLETVDPQWAVVSYGEGNSYGHPHSEVMKRLAGRGIPVWETAKSGAVILRTDGKQIRWTEYAKGEKRK